MIKKLRESVMPIYAIGAAWLLYALFFPLYKGVHFLAAAALSAAAYFAAKMIFPPKEVLVEKGFMELTGDEKADKMIEEANEYIRQMRTAVKGLPSGNSVAADEEKIEEVTEKIFGYLKDHPDESFDIHRFTSYYLPTTVKLLETYQNLNSKNVSAQNVTSTMKKIDDMLDKVIAAFENQLNGLYAYQAMDVSAEINVMQDILKTEGLLTEDTIDTVKAGVTGESAVRDFEEDAPSDGITLSLNEKK